MRLHALKLHKPSHLQEKIQFKTLPKIFLWIDFWRQACDSIESPFYHFMKKYLSVFCEFIVAAFVLAALAANAGETNYVGDAWNFMDSQKVVAEAADITAAKYTNCDAAIVEWKILRDYRGDGKADCQDETFVKVLTEKGRRGNRQLSFGFMLPYSTVAVAKLCLLYTSDAADDLL